MSKSGKQSITVTCKDVTAQLNIYIHDLTSETMPANDYPESSHNYEDNLDKTYTYTADGAYSLDVTFSNETEAETNFDYIYVSAGQRGLQLKLDPKDLVKAVNATVAAIAEPKPRL